MSLSRVILLYFLGLQPRDKAAMLVVYNRIFARRIYLKIEFSSQERQAFVLDHQHGRCDVTCKPAIRGTNSYSCYYCPAWQVSKGMGKGIPDRSWD